MTVPLAAHSSLFSTEDGAELNVTLTGGWTLTIPGEFADEWEEGGETWSAWHGGRTIWFTSWSVAGENDASATVLLEVLSNGSDPFLMSPEATIRPASRQHSTAGSLRIAHNHSR